MSKYLRQYPYKSGSNPYNANTIYTQGIYRGAIANGPETGYGILICLPYRTEQGVDKPDFGVQLYFANGDSANPNMFYRLSLEKSWQSWKKLSTTSSASLNSPTITNDNVIQNNITQ